MTIKHIPIVPISSVNRSCNGCTACCEGWLVGEVNGKHFYPGSKCHYLGENCCTIYETRPVNPCQDFKCAWLIDEDIPVWLKPSISKVLIINRKIDEYDYWEVLEAGSKIDSEALSWIFKHFINRKITNFRYQVNGGWNTIGEKEFLKYFHESTDS